MIGLGEGGVSFLLLVIKQVVLLRLMPQVSTIFCLYRGRRIVNTGRGEVFPASVQINSRSDNYIDYLPSVS